MLDFTPAVKYIHSINVFLNSPTKMTVRHRLLISWVMPIKMTVWHWLLISWVTIYFCTRLLPSPSLEAIGLSVGYETWSSIGWHHASLNVWSKYRLRLSRNPLHYGLTWPLGIPTVFQTPVTVPMHSPNGCLSLGLCKGTVKGSISARSPRRLRGAERERSCRWTVSKMYRYYPVAITGAIAQVPYHHY